MVPQGILTGSDIVTEESIVYDPNNGQRYRFPGLGKTPTFVYLTLLTSMFMHGGLMHLLGNMLYLYTFGDNIENLMGHARCLGFYLFCGVLASLTHVFTSAALNADLLVPSIGASGAISGVLGGYFVRFAVSRVRVLIFRFVREVPALLAIGVWFAFQLISSIGMLSGDSSGGLAYGAHIGGFIAGLVLVKLFLMRKAGIDERWFPH